MFCSNPMSLILLSHQSYFCPQSRLKDNYLTSILHAIERVSCLIYFCWQILSGVKLLTASVYFLFRFDYSNTFIWFEFYNAPLEKDISLICDVSDLLFHNSGHICIWILLTQISSTLLQTIRSWHIVGRLGGCNSMNMQVQFLKLCTNYVLLYGGNKKA